MRGTGLEYSGVNEKQDGEAEIEAAGAGHGNPYQYTVFEMYFHAAFDKPGERKPDRIEEDIRHNQERFHRFQSR